MKSIEGLDLAEIGWLAWWLGCAALIVGWLLSGCSARSQEVALVTAAGADLGATEAGLAGGAEEANPLLQRRSLRLLTKSATIAAVILLARDLDKDGHPKLATLLRWSTVSLWGGAATWNLTVAWGDK